MNEITFPLQPGMKGPAVADLQDALRLVVDRRVILANDEDRRRELMERLGEERAERRFDWATEELVGRFQEWRDLETSGGADEATATALNDLLRERGLLPPGSTEASLDSRISVACTVLDARGKPRAPRRGDRSWTRKCRGSSSGDGGDGPDRPSRLPVPALRLHPAGRG